MDGDREVVSGTAGSGKTARLLELFRQEQARLLASCSPGQAVWITPTNRSRRQIMRRLLDGSLRACLAPNVLTFDTFAERLLRTSNSQIAPLSGVAQRMVARTVIDAAQEAAALSYFTPIAQTSGFLDLFLGFLSDLKRNETWPEAFESRVPAARARVRAIGNCRACTATIRTGSTPLSLYDAEGRFWSAREVLAAGRRGAFGRLSLVIVDGFTDFTQPQYEILEHLSQSAQRVIISLPVDNPRADGPVREVGRRARGDQSRRPRTGDLSADSSEFRQRIRRLFSPHRRSSFRQPARHPAAFRRRRFGDHRSGRPVG